MYAHRIAKAWSKLADFYSMSETLQAIIQNFEVLFVFFFNSQEIKIIRRNDNSN